ncbi:hypothetical protein CDD82_2886 [Ophiocordyceps australis]|uniref:Uncharacterized protein n=1 Tax=Ophiocordyceps australis TaxID=1399860 RepID=A0A2C5XUD2_9HYPO|nr:hypothetical protein CDD82_2886 [Ophiocordyceps australis]
MHRVALASAICFQDPGIHEPHFPNPPQPGSSGLSASSSFDKNSSGSLNCMQKLFAHAWLLIQAKTGSDQKEKHTQKCLDPFHPATPTLTDNFASLPSRAPAIGEIAPNIRGLAQDLSNASKYYCQDANVATSKQPGNSCVEVCTEAVNHSWHWLPPPSNPICFYTACI